MLRCCVAVMLRQNDQRDRFCFSSLLLEIKTESVPLIAIGGDEITGYRGSLTSKAAEPSACPLCAHYFSPMK